MLAPGDLLLLLSDGIVEAMNREREMFGFDRLAHTLADIGTRTPTPTRVLTTVVEAVRRHCGARRAAGRYHAGGGAGAGGRGRAALSRTPDLLGSPQSSASAITSADLARWPVYFSNIKIDRHRQRRSPPARQIAVVARLILREHQPPRQRILSACSTTRARPANIDIAKPHGHVRRAQQILHPIRPYGRRRACRAYCRRARTRSRSCAAARSRGRWSSGSRSRRRRTAAGLAVIVSASFSVLCIGLAKADGTTVALGLRANVMLRIWEGGRRRFVLVL